MRNLLAQITNTQAGHEAKSTRFTYTPRGQKATQVKPNGNTVTFDYRLDGLLARKVEKQDDGTLVARHVLDYNRNGHRTRDASKVQNADDATKYLDVVRSYTYDPRDRISKVTKTDAATGGVLETESYVHDANSNVIEQTVDGVSTSYTYDRNRLVSATANGVTAGYNYDPYGRLLAVKSGGKVIESRSYDGFGRTIEHTKLNDTGDTVTSTYAYDPLDRTTTKTTGAGTAAEETTEFDYLGLSNKVIAEEIGGQVQRSYTYSAWGQRLSMLKHDTDGSGGETAQRSFYGYNPHTDVETLTTKTGETRATYGYTAYGSNDTEAFTGIDTPQPDQPGVEEPYNPYRFNHKRFDAASGSYDMGFRSYNPGLNRFTSRDLYLGARANMGLTVDGFTGNRYAFTAGNPISRIELDGHGFCNARGVCSHPSQSQEVISGTQLDADDPILSAGAAPAPSTPSTSGDVNMAGCMGFSFGCPVGEPMDINPNWHKVLDGLGQLPGSAVPDGINCGWYGVEGDLGNALLSCAAIIPVYGSVFTIGRLLGKGSDAGKAGRLANNKAVGDAAADRIASRYAGAKREVQFDTKAGVRRVDVLTANGLAIESKVGRTALTASIRRQIQKDVALMRSRSSGVKSVVWEFTQSPATGRVGPTAPLRKRLEEVGIEVVVR